MKFKKIIKSRVREKREEMDLTQQELGDLVGVSRQTIYYIEKGDYNPSLILAFKIADILKTPVNNLFYREPIIKDKVESLSIKEMKDIADKLNMNQEKVVSLSEIDETDLLKEFEIKELEKIAKELGYSLEELFQKD
ncbi:MAG: helix-turn-helix domain-containing protein [Candidatus Lokiarchaeota archaeon]|nr:helix-turn-helix domain-containing protein [Candidatus Lokiarchaeota archaeon]